MTSCSKKTVSESGLSGETDSGTIPDLNTVTVQASSPDATPDADTTATVNVTASATETATVTATETATVTTPATVTSPSTSSKDSGTGNNGSGVLIIARSDAVLANKEKEAILKELQLELEELFGNITKIQGVEAADLQFE